MAEIRKHFSSLASQSYDVLVIGGGINGAAVAWDCALRGFKTALVEKADFGGGASAGCFKIAHGGLRYLQHLDLLRLEESAAEQRILRLIAPRLIHPLPFLIPCYGLGMKSRAVLKTALTVYELLACYRNHGVAECHRLRCHRLISRDECLQRAPGISPDGLTGGLIYEDCQMSNCERLTFAVVQGAMEAGAVVCNYAEAVGLSTKPCETGRIIDQVTLRDKFSGNECSVTAKVVVNAAGPWADKVQQLLPQHSPGRVELPCAFSKGIQLVLPQMFSGSAVAVESRYRERAARISRGGRSYFMHPWRGRSLVGTSDELFLGDPDQFSITQEDIRNFIADLSAAYQNSILCAENVQFAFGGLRPVAANAEKVPPRRRNGESKETKILLRDLITDHARGEKDEQGSQLRNLISAVGVKYTTFRSLGHKVTDMVSRKLTGAVRPCRTAATPLPGGDIGDFQTFITEQQARHPELSPSALRHLVMNYGTELDVLCCIMKESPKCASQLAPNNETLGAEVVHAARNEQAVRLIDAVLRRTGLGSVGFPGDDALKCAAELMAAELGWDKGQVEEELSETKLCLTFR